MKKFLITLCFLPSLCWAQSDFRMMVITNYLEAGKMFYTNSIVNKYTLYDGKWIAVTNLTGRYKWSIGMDDIIFTIEKDKDVWITLTSSKDDLRYPSRDKKEIMVMQAGTNIINGEKILKFLELKKLTIESFMQYWMDNREDIIQKRGDILK